MEGKTKTAIIDQKSNFFLFLCFFLKIQDIRKSKTPILKRGWHKNVLGQVLTILQTGPFKEVLDFFFHTLQIQQ